MKNYPKEYEDVFTSKRIKDKCDLALVSTDKDMNTKEYMGMLQTLVSGFEKDLFNNLVKLNWLSRRFVYGDKHRINQSRNGIVLDAAFAVFMRTHIGVEMKLFTRPFIFKRIVSYFDDFFINFDEGDPFKEDHKYPYKYMTLECLSLVSDMPERMSLLKQGEYEQMSYTKFMDYVINYIGCYNDEHGQTYILKSPTSFPPYIKSQKYGEEETKASNIYKG